MPPWLPQVLFAAAIVMMIVRQLPRLRRDMRGPVPDVGEPPPDAEPIALNLPNDDGLFTWSLRMREDRMSSDEERQAR